MKAILAFGGLEVNMPVEAKQAKVHKALVMYAEPHPGLPVTGNSEVRGTRR